MTPFDACPMPPTDHQLTAITKITAEPYVFLTDEMGMGKSKTIVDSASVLFSHGQIDKVIIVAPAQVKPVWLDDELGQLATHCWPTISNRIHHFHSRRQSWHTGADAPSHLEWIVTNYEYIRRGFRARSRHIPEELEVLLDHCTDRTLLVLDESSAVKTGRAYQTRAAMQLRRKCGRVVLMTGTPIAHSPMDLLSQSNILHPSILSDIPGTATNIIQFRSRYCNMGGFQGKQILSFRNLEDLQNRLKPHTLRRLKKDCLDLPAKLDPVTITTTLSKETWKTYKDMRDHMIVELEGSVSVAQQAVTKLIRLSQITSGMIGGIEGSEDIKELSREKIDTLVAWVTEQLEIDPNFKLVVWTQFRADVERVRDALAALPHELEIGTLWGGGKATERQHALRLLHPQTAPEGAAAVIGTPGAGALGITLAAAATVVYLNNPHSLNIRVQSEDRNHRPGQTRPVSYFDMVATGPKGQRTIDHIVLKALRQKRDLADWTAAAWLDELKKQKS
jgi:SNF2 family DNA or RNA helicase